MEESRVGNCLLAFVVQVNVHSQQWELMTFTAQSDDRVKKINEHVRSKIKVPVQDQVLQLGSKTLKPQRTLSSYGIDRETTIHLTLKVVKPSDEKLTLELVESGDEGQRYRLQVRRSSSVAQVKKMIETKTAIPRKKQVVTCNGKKLEDGKIMADYGIKKGHLLFLTYPCIGG
ncbi:ubiquitin D-like [Hippopotamus amphibius kiboko]|uniref:ubiquitin D-like n=1 Tax=Hippopotamus amphibius kiboko TaxID=575201 RepID=UPI00259A0356|nr:ubiquitin D-like [Hippopotamus amphibius kiboko]